MIAKELAALALIVVVPSLKPRAWWLEGFGVI